MAKQKRKAPQGKPITSYQLFPAIVALWFGALFGLGSLAIRPGLIESLVISAHIDSIIPAAAPPLGVTARILLALGMAALGALLGTSIARRIARPKYEASQSETIPATPSVKLRPRDTHPDAPARRPISAHDEIGNDQAFVVGRRRSLTISGSDERVEFHDPAMPPAPAPIAANAPLELGNYASPHSAQSADAFDDEPQNFGRAAQQPVPETPVYEPARSAAPSPLETPDLTADPESLDMVSLALRLTHSMNQRRIRAAAAAAQAASQPAAMARLISEIAPLDVAPHAAPSQPGPPVLPAALRPISLDYGQDDDQAEVPSLLPPRLDRNPVVSAAAIAPITDLGGEDDEDADDAAAETIGEDGGYSSLLNLSRVAGPRQTVLADPVESAQDPQETERALRAALASLQRMSGAA